MSISDMQSWPDGTAMYSFDRLPCGPDYFLVSAEHVEDLRREWTAYVTSSPRTQHPNNFLPYRVCALDASRPESCDVNICIDQQTRYHGATKTLSRNQFVLCVHFPNFGKRPYLVVSREWFDAIEREAFSLYALIDAVGMKGLLSAQGIVDASQLARLRDGIDTIARQHPDHAFLTFADNVLVKTNWTASRSDYTTTYEPERFVGLVGEVAAVFAVALGLKAYAVVTQGANQVDDPTLLHVSNEKNHILFASLATPFAELFEIDRSARSAVHDGRHPPKELYLSKSLFLTLRFRQTSSRDRLRSELAPFVSRVTAEDRRSYLPVDRGELTELLRTPDDAV